MCGVSGETCMCCVCGEDSLDELFECVRAQSLQLCLTVTLWTVVRQALLSMGFSRQEYLSGLPFPSPKILNQ